MLKCCSGDRLSCQGPHGCSRAVPSAVGASEKGRVRNLVCCFLLSTWVLSQPKWKVFGKHPARLLDAVMLGPKKWSKPMGTVGHWSRGSGVRAGEEGKGWSSGLTAFAFSIQPITHLMQDKGQVSSPAPGLQRDGLVALMAEVAPLEAGPPSQCSPELGEWIMAGGLWRASSRGSFSASVSGLQAALPWTCCSRLPCLWRPIVPSSLSEHVFCHRPWLTHWARH